MRALPPKIVREPCHRNRAGLSPCHRNRERTPAGKTRLATPSESEQPEQPCLHVSVSVRHFPPLMYRNGKGVKTTLAQRCDKHPRAAPRSPAAPDRRPRLRAPARRVLPVCGGRFGQGLPARPAVTACRVVFHACRFFPFQSPRCGPGGSPPTFSERHPSTSTGRRSWPKKQGPGLQIKAPSFM